MGGCSGCYPQVKRAHPHAAASVSMVPSSSLTRRDTRFQHAVGAIDTLEIRGGPREFTENTVVTAKREQGLH
jgi:hypothetical protein